MCPTTPILLVGLQIDLRDDTNVIEKLAQQGQKPIAYGMGEKWAKNVGAVKYMECSALTRVLYDVTDYYDVGLWRRYTNTIITLLLDQNARFLLNQTFGYHTWNPFTGFGVDKIMVKGLLTWFM